MKLSLICHPNTCQPDVVAKSVISEVLKTGAANIDNRSNCGWYAVMKDELVGDMAREIV